MKKGRERYMMADSIDIEVDEEEDVVIIEDKEKKNDYNLADNNIYPNNLNSA